MISLSKLENIDCNKKGLGGSHTPFLIQDSRFHPSPLHFFPLFSQFLLSAVRGLCSLPEELTGVITVSTVTELKLLMSFFRRNETKRQTRRAANNSDKGRNEGIDASCLKIRHLLSRYPTLQEY